MTEERCSLCDCRIHRNGDYAKPTLKGRSHANSHHYVAERYFGRSGNRPGTGRERIFQRDPWGMEGKTGIFCYDCGEVLLHNPVLLPEEISELSELYRLNNLTEDNKEDDMHKYRERIKLFHEVIQKGLDILLTEARKKAG